MTEKYIMRKLEESDKDIYLDTCRYEETGINYDSPLARNIFWSVAVEDKNKMLYAIEEIESKKFCGYCQVDLVGSTPEIGIVLRPEYQGKGIGGIAIKQLIYNHKNYEGLEYFLVRISKDNKNSIKLFEKLGAKPIERRDSKFMTGLKNLAKTKSELESLVEEMVEEDKNTLCFAIYAEDFE